ncbi:acyltransferase family protein [Butyrivibrio fibrisolvens]|uniref:acyltransferase family protein n=1 Tax=Butyrivibrio fibrisolvens TaxID=831 RepID=UPI0004100C2D|nr:acyltransferase [Butyrivibrio fibrisolvens]
MIMQSKMERKRIYTIDFIKFIAACCIVCHHYQQLLDVRFSRANFYEGYFGFHNLVELFFIISGFLTVRKNAYSVGKSKEYFLHIIYRIYPMAAIATIFTALLEYAYYLKYNDYFWGVVPSLWRLFNSLLLTFRAGAIDTVGIINPLWFLCVLLICHVIYTFTIFISTKKKYNVIYLWILCIFIGESAVQSGINVPFYNTSMGRGTAFFVGVVLYLIWTKVGKSKLMILSSVVTIIVVWLTYRLEYNLYADNQRGVLTYILFPSLIIVLLKLDVIVPERIGTVFGFMGSISYEIFLWHFGGILVLEFINRGYLNLNICSYKTMLIFLLVIVGFSSISYIFVEKPISKKIFKYKL